MKHDRKTMQKHDSTMQALAYITRKVKNVYR